MKRITEIEIENYRAFSDLYKIELPIGENLLIYGENGSGKSSLFKAARNFFSSSRNPALNFVKNNQNLNKDGHIKFIFHDYEPINNSITSPFGEIVTFGSSAISTNASTFVKDAELIKGFLDYRNLLDVYFHKDPNPNLFELIVLNILGNHFNTAKTYRFAEKWQQLQDDLIKNPRTRNEWIHRNAKGDLPGYELDLVTVLRDIFTELNTNFLNKYFSELGIEIDFTLQPITFHYGTYKWEWQCIADLRIQIRYRGTTIATDYADVMNEARLSAFSLCLYLASLKRNPTAFDYKILFLDDVFIGLDTSNRLPLLDILKNEFSDYQIFIATYDRYWYETSLRWLENQMPGRWIFYEMYVHEPIAAGSFDVPIITNYGSNMAKASAALSSDVKPDYPGAANCFRKYAEEILSNKDLISEQNNRNQFLTFSDEYGELTRAYKLNQYISKCFIVY